MDLVVRPAQPDGAAAEERRSGLGKALSLYSAYGWRGRIGLIAPSTNTTLEPEFARMAPNGVAIHTSRVYQAGGQEPSTYRRMADDIAVATRLLETAEVDVITFGCTSCTYFVPPDEIRTTITDIAKCPAVLTAEAVVAALEALDVRRVSLIGPRTRFVTEREEAYLREAGFDVVETRCLGLGIDEEERRAIGRVPPQALHRLAQAADRPETEALFVSCTQLPTIDMIEPLERVLGKPVITSNQAVFWRCLRLIGVNEAIGGLGTLLAHN
jgi:maleate cis-trans isomerase